VSVVVAFDADPPRLRRADGLIVRFPPSDAGYQVIEVGWAKSDRPFDPLFRWRGFVYQELQPGDGAALLVGHVPKGGYCSAVVRLTDRGVEFEFADRVPAGEDGLQRVVADTTLHRCSTLESTGIGVRIEEAVLDDAFLVRRCMTMTRPADAKPFTHRHHLAVPPASRAG
jgi:hypothetical protein